MSRGPNLSTCAALLLAVVVSGAAAAQQIDPAKVHVEAKLVAPGVAMITGPGGNMAVAFGSDAAFLVDDQFAPLTDRIRAAVATLTDRPIRFVLNTHLHDDHTGGNENLGKAGTLIVAHDNVRLRLAAEQVSTYFDMRIPPSPAAALPVITFSDAVTFHLNGETIHAFHVPPAHTDGDAIVHFRNADVVHAGDLFFNGVYPFVDFESGGSLDGVIAAADRLLALAGDETRIIPGHGPLAGAAELRAYRDMLAGVRAAIAPLVAAGRRVDEIVAARPTARWDEQWGGDDFTTPDVFTRIVALGMGAKK